MLKTKYEHFYGSQEKHDIQLVKVILDTENLLEIEALESGWLISDNQWYSCRSVRLSIDNYIFRNKLPNTITHYFTTSDLGLIDKIYEEYKAYKKFDEDYDIHKDPNRSIWMIVEDEGVPVAFTKFIRYQEGLESQFTCWNYHKPKLQLGKNIIDFEVKYASQLALNHLYIGQGYEKGSIYKADLPGFEWWTGSGWSEDRELYKKLCARDSSINTIEDIARAHDAPHFT